MANEMHLIDANKLMVCHINVGTVMFPKMEAFVRAEDIKAAPIVDAVEVVRCGKCLYYSETTGKDSGKPCGYGVCTKPFHITNIVANEDFCSFGQSRADAKMDGDGNA